MILDKHEFNKLDIQDQLKYINNILVKGESLRNISSNLGISKTTIHNRFIEQCYIFNKEAIQYIKDIEYTPYTGSILMLWEMQKFNECNTIIIK